MIQQIMWMLIVLIPYKRTYSEHIFNTCKVTNSDNLFMELLTIMQLKDWSKVLQK